MPVQGFLVLPVHRSGLDELGTQLFDAFLLVLIFQFRQEWSVGVIVYDSE